MNKPKAENITWHSGLVEHVDRCRLLGQCGATIWMTGLSGSGKSTIACALEQTLLHRSVKAYRLDGDNIRYGLNRDLGFSAEERAENIRRIGEVARLFTDACTVTIASFISPYRQDRAVVRQLHEAHGLPFIECFIDVPLEVAESRDPKGLYQKARAGEIKGFTGIDDPYESPENPEITLPTDELTIKQSVETVIQYLIDQGIIGSGG